MIVMFVFDCSTMQCNKVKKIQNSPQYQSDYDIQRWKNLKVSLQGRISTVKMNLLPRFNFFFSMLPLSPPPGYFKEINSIISKFIWNDKCPRIKLTTLQHPNSAGGLAVPNFELYYWSFQLKALHNWVDPQSTVSWRVIEADKVKPNRLQDILFTGTGKKGDNYKFGPVVANSIKIWKTVERRIGGPFKFCNYTFMAQFELCMWKSSICPTQIVDNKKNIRAIFLLSLPSPPSLTLTLMWY